MQIAPRRSIVSSLARSIPAIAFASPMAPCRTPPKVIGMGFGERSRSGFSVHCWQIPRDGFPPYRFIAQHPPPGTPQSDHFPHVGGISLQSVWTGKYTIGTKRMARRSKRIRQQTHMCRPGMSTRTSTTSCSGNRRMILSCQEASCTDRSKKNSRVSPAGNPTVQMPREPWGTSSGVNSSIAIGSGWCM